MTLDCAKCRSRMEPGFVHDSSDQQVKTSRWIEGKPEKSFFLGLKTKGKRQYDVLTWRCSRCGYLEAYAR